MEHPKVQNDLISVPWMGLVWAHNGTILIWYAQMNKSKMGSFLVYNGFILIPLSNYWLLNMGLYWFDSKLIFAHFCLYCGKRIPIIEFYNSIMGFYNFKDGQNNSMMGYYSFEMGLYIIHYGLMFFPWWPV